MIKNLRTKTALRVLATKSVTSVASYDFRSVEEINEFVKNLKADFEQDTKNFEVVKKVLAATHKIAVTAVKIKELKTHSQPSGEAITFVKPNMDKLTKAFSVVDKYQDKIDNLDSVINLLSLELKGERGAPNTLKELKALRATIKKKLDESYKFLSSLASNHEPKQFKDIVQSVHEKITKTFSELYEDEKQSVYLIPSDNNNLLIVHYIELKNFIDDDEFEHPSYYVVVSGLINTETGTASYYINTLQSFAQPGRFGNGIKVTDKKDAATQALIMLEHAGFSSLIERTPIPTYQGQLDRIDWRAPKEWIKEVKLIDSDIITVTFTNKVNSKNIQDAINHFIIDLKTTLIPNNYKMGIKPRKHMQEKPPKVDFIFTLPDAHQRKEIKLDAGKVKALKAMFGLSDRQAGELVKHFNNM